MIGLQDLERDRPQPRPPARPPGARAPSSRPVPTRPRGTRRPGRGRARASASRRATTPPDGSRRACAPCAELQPGARDALLRSLRGLPREPLETHLRGCGLGRASSRRGPYSDAVPEGDTIHHAANRIRPVLEGQRPGRDRDAAPALRPRSLARAPEGPRGDRRRRPRQAPVPALRGRPADPLAPADDRQVARARRRLADARATRGWSSAPASSSSPRSTARCSS